MSEAKPLINHRWHLPSLEDMLDRMLPKWEAGKHPDFSGPDGYTKLRAGFQQFGESLLFQLGLVLEKAAGRGISEALALIQDPDYCKTVKRRSKREMERQKEHEERHREKFERWQRCELTEKERIHELGRIAYELNYHRKQIEELQARQLRVETSNHVVVEEAPGQGGGDSWDDTISF